VSIERVDRHAAVEPVAWLEGRDKGVEGITELPQELAICRAVRINVHGRDVRADLWIGTRRQQGGVEVDDVVKSDVQDLGDRVEIDSGEGIGVTNPRAEMHGVQDLTSEPSKPDVVRMFCTSPMPSELYHANCLLSVLPS
jgi:hypothetical protein